MLPCYVCILCLHHNTPCARCRVFWVVPFCKHSLRATLFDRKQTRSSRILFSIFTHTLSWRHMKDQIKIQGLTLSIWFTCPSGTWIWKCTCPAKIFTCPANICTSPVKLMYTSGKISTCPDWKITCPVGHVTRTVYAPWNKIYMPLACGHALLSSPEI